MTELLGGFAGMVRHRALKKLEAQTAALALFAFISICTTWIDAWDMLKSITLNFNDLWAPILLATSYYLAAAVIFPRDHEQYAHLHTYFAERKTFIVSMLWAALLLETYASRAFFASALRSDPARFWAWLVPYNIVINVCFLALLIVRGRRANIALLSAQILLLLVPYWDQGVIDRAAERLWGI